MSRGTSDRRQNREIALRDAAVRLRLSGLTYTEIAKQLGITKKQAQAKSRSARDKDQHE